MSVGRVSLGLAILAVALLAVAAGGCGSVSDDSTDDELVTKSLVDPDDLPEVVISDEDREQFKDDSAERAMLDYWESLQYQDLSSAVNALAPGLRRAVGEKNLFEAFRVQAPLYRARKPGITEAVSRDGVTTVRYLLQDLVGGESTHSVVFKREDGRWRVVFDSYTGDGLAAVAQARADALIDPSAQEPSAEGRAAGARAARRQQVYLESVLNAN